VVLSDRSIREELATGRLSIEPLAADAIQPSSVDLRLDRLFRVFKKSDRPHIDVREPSDDCTELIEVESDKPFLIRPGEFVLANTLETITVPNDLVARLDGRSSLGRLGLLVHATAGYVDPGFSGKLTLELANAAPLPIAVYCGMKICQISFLRLSTPVDRPYGSPGLGSKYQGQQEPTPSRVHEDFKRENG
jgi:dCTP deaminase